jgi:hypothetical protein
MSLALPAYLVAILGVVLVLAYQAAGLLTVAIIATGLFAIGWVAGFAAENWLLPKRPVWAVRLFNIWMLCPSIAGAGAVAILIYLSATLDPDTTGATGLDKEAVKTALAAIGAFLAAIFIKMMDEADEKVIGERVRLAFEAKYQKSDKQDFPKKAYPIVLGESDVEKWVYNAAVEGVEGWGYKARRKRAKQIAAAMVEPAEEDRVKEWRRSKKPAAESQPEAAVASAIPAASSAPVTGPAKSATD